MKTKIKKFALIAFITGLVSACYSYDPYNPKAARTGDYPPRAPAFEDAKASCYWEESYGDYIWHFEAWVTYPQHNFGQIKTVYAEVYQGEYLVDWFTLGQESGKYWDTMRGERVQTRLWCNYYQDYEVDFYVFDRRNNSDAMTVWNVNE